MAMSGFLLGWGKIGQASGGALMLVESLDVLLTNGRVKGKSGNSVVGECGDG